MWGHIPAADYRKVIVGLIFLRYISAAFDKRYQQLVKEGDGFENDRDAYMEENIFYVPECARWDTISAATHTPEIGKVLDDAMRAIEDENKTLKNVLPKIYANPDIKRYKYPPEGMEDAVQTVLSQCELWTDNNEYDNNGKNNKVTYVDFNKSDLAQVADDKNQYEDD